MNAIGYGDEWNVDLSREDEPRDPRFCPLCGEPLTAGGWCRRCEDYP